MLKALPLVRGCRNDLPSTNSTLHCRMAVASVFFPRSVFIKAGSVSFVYRHLCARFILQEANANRTSSLLQFAVMSNRASERSSQTGATHLASSGIWMGKPGAHCNLS